MTRSLPGRTRARAPNVPMPPWQAYYLSLLTKGTALAEAQRLVLDKFKRTPLRDDIELVRRLALPN